jgi:YYY domain-containing protein
MLLAGEAIFAGAFLLFVVVRMLNPDLWQPWFGGEKQMEFAFLNGILRSPTFPPVNPHFAGGVINYYYFGLYLVAYLVKLTGIYAEVAFNLTIATLFGLTVINTFAVAYSAVKGHAPLGPAGTSIPWTRGLGVALLAPVFVTIIGNLDGFAQLVRSLASIQPGPFESALPGLKSIADSAAGLRLVAGGQAQLPVYDFWAPSRVIVPTINEFPYWSFLFADLHPHIIGIPLAGMFLALALVLIENAHTDWRVRWRYGLALLAVFALFLGAMAAVNLWELPTYLGLGILAFLISQFRGQGRIHWLLTLGVAFVYAAGAYLLFLPFFASYVNVGASGVGLLRAPDAPHLWLLVWGFLGFMFLSWLLFTATRPALPVVDSQGRALSRPSGIERAVSLQFRRFEQLPRAIYLHRQLVTRPRFLYLVLLAIIPLAVLVALVMFLLGWHVLALCLLPLGLAVAVLWRRGRAADAGSLFASMLGATGLALLAGTQIFYLKDFLDGSDYYRMNTLFKFFNQVWVLWGVMAAIAVPRLIDEWVAPEAAKRASPLQKGARLAWTATFVALFVASLAFPLLGTPSRLDQRMPGWRPPIGTLNGLDFMREGEYGWPDYNNVFELRYEWGALQWLLDNVRGNATILESSEVEYYRAWGTRMASNTGLSGLKGMHEQEQRYPEDVGYRDGLHRELWATVDIPRTQQILDEVQVDLVYVGQLERYLHPAGVQKFEAMAAEGLLTPIYENDRVVIYARPGRLQQGADGVYVPAQG